MIYEKLGIAKNNGYCKPEEGKEDVLGESVTSRLLNVSFQIFRQMLQC